MERFYYLLKIQYLGFRYHGWQKQQGVKTVQGVLEKALGYILGHHEFKTLAAGRTDAMVSAQDHLCELFLKSQVDVIELKQKLDRHLPADMRVLDIIEIGPDFQVMSPHKSKTYIYFFNHGEKAHPFSAPFMANIVEELNIDLMKQGACLFVGEHSFHNYCRDPHEKKLLRREIIKCELKENDLYTASFFPKKSYALHVTGSGFARQQIRRMMGMLIEIGLKEKTISDLEESLKVEVKNPITFVAPAAGLVLQSLEL